jgi:hypothetical protein
MARGLLVAAVAVIAAACGSTAEAPTDQRAVSREHSSCVNTLGEQEGIDGTEPAYPTAIGPDGPVAGLKRELDGSAVYIADSGVCSVAETAAGTWAVTGIVVDERDDEPVAGATVILDALEPEGLDMLLAGRTDEDGTFAFVNVPIEGARSCYRTRVRAEGFLPFTSVDVLTPQTYGQSISLSRRGYFDGMGIDRRACS